MVLVTGRTGGTGVVMKAVWGRLSDRGSAAVEQALLIAMLSATALTVAGFARELLGNLLSSISLPGSPLG